MSEQRLEKTLVMLADEIAWPEPSSTLATRVGARLEARPPAMWRWRPVTAIGVSVLLAGVLTFSPTVRQAVADLLALAGIEIRLTQETPAAGADLDLGRPVALEDAVEQVDFPLLVPTEPGPPDGIYVDPDQRVHIVWEGTEALPAAGDTRIGLLLTQYRLTDGPLVAGKAVGTGARVVGSTVNGAPALWIEGAFHTFTLLDEEGEPREETTRLAANVLLWEAEGIAYRLETTGDVAAARTVAESLQPAGVTNSPDTRWC